MELPQELRAALQRLPFSVPEDTRITFNPADFEDLARIEALGQILQKGVATTFLKEKQFPLTVSLFARIGADMKPANTIVTTTLHTCNEVTKSMFFRFLRVFAEKVDAVAIAHMSEEWMYDGDDREGLRAHQAANNGSFEGYPGVFEQLGVHIECGDHTWRWHAPILRSGESVRLASWSALHVKGRGRMVDLLQRRQEGP